MQFQKAALNSEERAIHVLYNRNHQKTEEEHLDEPLKAASNSVQVFFHRLYAGKKKEKKKPRVLLIETYSVQVSQFSVLKHLSLLEVWWSSWCDVGVQLSDLTKREYPSVTWLITAAFCRATTSSFWRETFKL